MLSRLLSLFRFLTPAQRMRWLRLQVLVVLMAFAEVCGVLAIGPFMALVADMGKLNSSPLLQQIYRASQLRSPEDFLFWVGVGVLATLALAAAISTYTSWRLLQYGQQLGTEVGIRLFQFYMRQPWLFHASGNSGHLINKIGLESVRVTNNILVQLLHINARAVLAIAMSAAIFLYSPIVALSGLVLFAAAYGLIYKIVRKRLARNGSIVTAANGARMKLMQEGFGGIKDTLLLGRQADFNERFQRASEEYGRAQAANQVAGQVPRYAMELVAFGAIIALVLYLLRAHRGDLSTVLPFVAIYALAGAKLLPAFQAIYVALTTVRSNLASFDQLEHDLAASSVRHVAKPVVESGTKVALSEIRLEGIRFRYPGKKEWALDGLTLTVPARQVIGLVGPSGSGKSTAIDILLGLIGPDEGQISIDGEPVTDLNRRAWQNGVGYVPQAIFLTDASIRENIAFGLPASRIDEDRVRRAARMAHLDELIDSLPAGLDTRVGERGVQLSGGQRQRIGVARALYDDAEVLVLDEATSALDGITEKLVMDAIHDFAGKKTIVMIAHRLSTVKPCDRIYLMDAGRIVDSGTYDELVDRNPVFQRMAVHT